MAATYEPIATITVSGASTNSVTFSNIAATWTDLVVIAKYSLSSETLQARFNSDSGSNYSCTNLYGNGSSAASNRRANFTEARLGLENANQNGLGTGRFHFMSYTNTNVYKTILCESAVPGQEVTRRINLWRNTAAITSINLSSFNASWNFSSGDTFSLYGIKAA